MDKIGKYNVAETENGELLVTGKSISDRKIKAPATAGIKINGAWYLDTFPNHAVLEKEDGTLARFNITPFRELGEKDFVSYKGYHPRKLKGQPLPNYLYRFYGLNKNEESLSETVRVRVSPSDLERAETFAKNLNKTVSEILRDYVRSL